MLILTGSPLYAATENDPFEKMNRLTYGFISGFDEALPKRLASSYRSYTPKEAKAGIRDFFNNLNDVRVGTSDLRQLKFSEAAKDFGRFAVTSIVALAGVFDVAEAAFKLDKNRQDFGKP